MNYSIRRLGYDDLERVDDFFRNLTMEGQMFYNYCHGNENNLKRQLESPVQTRIDFGAMERLPDGAERMIGHIFLWHLNTGIPWLGICLREGMTGKHLGAELMKYLEEYCRKEGFGGMMLTTHVANIRAQALYRNVGFQFLGTHANGEFLFYKPFER